MHRGRAPHENEGKDWANMSTSQGTPKVASILQKLVEGHGADSPSLLSEGMSSADTFISDF